MPSADGSDGAHPRGGPGSCDPRATVDTLLIEALIHVLVEKGVLTRDDALSVVQTAAQVRLGALDEGLTAREPGRADLTLLQRLYRSFEALADRPGGMPPDSDNIFRLRPRLHGDRPEFPGDD